MALTPVTEAPATAKTCFVVSPIGAEGSAERSRADWLFHLVISEVLSAHGYAVERADHITQPGLIDIQIIQRLRTADLVIADLTGFNPNVFYEIGIRHCIPNKAVIHMYDGDVRLPFDVQTFRAIPYRISHPKELEKARNDLEAQVKETEAADFQPVTPFQIAIDFEEFTKSGETLKEEITTMVLALANRVSTLEAIVSTPRPAASQTLARARVLAERVGTLLDESNIGVGPMHPEYSPFASSTSSSSLPQ